MRKLAGSRPVCDADSECDAAGGATACHVLVLTFSWAHVPVFVCVLFWAAGVSGFAESTLTVADAVGEDRPL